MSSQPLADQLIRAVDAADSSKTLLDAVRALADAALPETIPNLVAALSYNNPGVAVAAVDGLIRIGKPAVEPLLTLLDTYNYGARAWALRALSGIHDPRAFELLLDTAQNDFALSVRRAAACGLGGLHWQELPKERQIPSQVAALDVLIRVCQDPEWIVRYAAVVGLESLAQATAHTQPQLTHQVLAQFLQIAQHDDEAAVRARSQLGWQTLSSIPSLSGQSFGHPSEPSDHSPAQSTNTPQPSLEEDWRATLERLYNRKSQERIEGQPLSEGDPRRFRQWVLTVSDPAP
jgi:phycocyanobilin lyase subunit beta